MDILTQLLQKFTRQEVEQTPQVPQQNYQEVVNEVIDTIKATFKQAIAEGKNDKVVRILSGKDPIPDNSILGEAINALKNKFEGQLKLSAVEAEMLAGKIVPGVMGTLVTKTAEGEEQLRDIMQTLNTDLMGDIEGKFGKYLKDDDKGPLNSLF